ncbi:three-helix bundle dimerization domain-containing protein [Rhodococcus opacus]|uniref:three-helix bundle dimerization domain-containing protein n=1 Tax=Rhodococcus TaxID=1827 RepID=UPI00352D88B1
MRRNDEERLHLTRVIDGLQFRYPDVSRDTIDEVVRSAHSRFADRKVHDFVLLLIERAAREKIQELVAS